MSPTEITAAASRLCTACGLCCNGVLFHIVRLQPTDSVKQLESLGMTVSRKKREPYFRQPCSFLNDCTCTQYVARPVRCRLFECQQIKHLTAQEVTEADARQRIDSAKLQVARVETLLLAAGNTAVNLPLFERCAQVLATATDVSLLVEEMQDLNAVLNAEFRLEPQALP